MGNVYITAYGLKVRTFARGQKHTHTHMGLNLFVLGCNFSSIFSHLPPPFQVWRVNTKYNLLYVNGSVPGHRNCLLKVKIAHSEVQWSMKSKVIHCMLSFVTKIGDLAPLYHHTCKTMWSIFTDTVLVQQCVCMHVCICLCVPLRGKGSARLNDVGNIHSIHLHTQHVMSTHTSYYLFVDKQ